jgi:ABC-type bacteriocin/lantibiotic exporter with double-glycine peptidase domain
MIIITHDDSILDFVDRKVYLDAGKIVKEERNNKAKAKEYS